MAFGPRGLLGPPPMGMGPMVGNRGPVLGDIGGARMPGPGAIPISGPGLLGMRAPNAMAAGIGRPGMGGPGGLPGMVGQGAPPRPGKLKINV